MCYAGNCTWGDNFPPDTLYFPFCDVSLRQLTSFCEKLNIWVPHWYICFMYVCFVLRFRVLQPDFHGCFYSPKSDYKCDYTANIWFPDEQWVLSDTVRYIYNSNTAQNPGYYSYWHWIHNSAATTELPSVLDDWIVLWCQSSSSTSSTAGWKEMSTLKSKIFPAFVKQSHLGRLKLQYLSDSQSNIWRIFNYILSSETYDSLVR